MQTLRITAIGLCASLTLLLGSLGSQPAAPASAPASASATNHSDWPRIYGPNGSAVSTEKGLLHAFPATGPAVLWSVNLGLGWGGAPGSLGEVFVLARPDAEKDVLRGLDLEPGKELWSLAIEAPGQLAFDGTRNVPVLGDDAIYVQSALGKLSAVDRHTHRVLWSHHAVEEFRDNAAFGWRRAALPKWGFTQAPVVWNDLVIIAPQTETVGLVAYDRITGKQAWRSPYVGRNWFSHASPKLVKLGGVEQIVMLANKHPGKDPPAIISGIEASTGRLLWQTETWHRYNVPIPSPVAVADDTLFFTGGYTIGCFGLRVRDVPSSQPVPSDVPSTTRPATTSRRTAIGRRASDDPGGFVGPPANLPWSAEFTFKDNTNLTSHIQPPVLYEGYIYGQSFDAFHNKVNNGLVCLTPAGELKWKSGPDVLYDSGGFLIADGVIYVIDGKSGDLCLVLASPDHYHELARAKLLSPRGGQIWSPPALSNGRLLLRDLNTLKCVDVRAN